MKNIIQIKLNFYILMITFLSLLLTLANTVPLSAQMTTTEIDQIVEDAMQAVDHTVGFAIGVVKDGKIVHVKGYGTRSIDSEDLVSADTPFGIASNSKAFTSAALAILVDQGKIKWDDKVTDYLPEFKMYNQYVTEEFNIQDLLTHRSGLGLGVGDLMIFPEGSDFTIDDVLRSFQYFKPTSAFRTKFDYDNLLYLVAGELTARVSGKSWENFVQEEILNTLGMKNAFASFEEAIKNGPTALPHSLDGKTIKGIKKSTKNLSANEAPKMNGAAGGIWASAQDMCQWMLLQLAEGRYGDDLSKVLYSAEQQQEMWKMHTPMNLQQDPNSPFKSHFSGYGLGWFVSDFDGYFKVEHSGLIAGMSSEVTLIPELELGIVVLNNSEGAGLLNGLLGFILLDEYLKLETGVNWIEMAKGLQQQRQKMGDSDTQKVWAQVAANKSAKVNHDHYIGIYEDNWFGQVEILEKNGELWFKSLKSPKLNGKMALYKDQTFAIKWQYQDMKADALATFSVDKNGEAEGIKMKGISRFIDFSFDFQDLNLKKKSEERPISKRSR